MTTEAQRTANRANAQKSTGPRTDAGKLASSQNARIHGFSGRIGALPDDEALLYVQLSERYVSELQPVTLVEEELVKTIADCNWQLNRLRAAEEQITREMCGNQLSQSGPIADLAIARAIRRDCEGPAGLDRLARYRAHFQRALHQSLHELDRRQIDRRKADRLAPTPDVPQDDANTQSATAPIKTSPTPIGFVWQNCDFAQLLAAIKDQITARRTPHESAVHYAAFAAA